MDGKWGVGLKIESRMREVHPEEDWMRIAFFFFKKINRGKD
jgi:hypothetical protein